MRTASARRDRERLACVTTSSVTGAGMAMIVIGTSRRVAAAVAVGRVDHERARPRAGAWARSARTPCDALDGAARGAVEVRS